MRQGTTPTHNFRTSFDTTLIESLKIVYKQGDDIVLTKNAEDCTISRGVISTTLTQEETLSFNYDEVVRIQVRILTKDKKSLVSDIIMRTVEECLDGKVLS